MSPFGQSNGLCFTNNAKTQWILSIAWAGYSPASFWLLWETLFFSYFHEENLNHLASFTGSRWLEMQSSMAPIQPSSLRSVEPTYASFVAVFS